MKSPSQLYAMYQAADASKDAAYENYMNNIRCPVAAEMFRLASESRRLAFLVWIQST
jgi:hypothetical protein